MSSIIFIHPVQILLHKICCVKFFSLETTFSIYMPINAPYLHFCPNSDSKTEPLSTSSLRPCWRNNKHAMVSTISCLLRDHASSLPSQKPTLYKVKVVFSKPVHAVRVRGGGGLPGPNHGPFTAKPSSHHVDGTLRITLPTFTFPTLSADAEPT